MIQNTGKKILRIKEVIALTGLSRVAIYYNRAENFPQAVKIGVRTIGWYEHEIQNWISNLKRRN